VPRWLIQLFKTTVSIGLLWLLLSRVDVNALARIARQSSMTWVMIALGSYTVAVLASAWRWHRLLRTQDVDMSLRAVTESSVVALFFNNFLPTNIGGDVMRIRDSSGPAGSSARAATVVVADRVVGLLALIIFAALGGAMSAKGRVPFPVAWIWMLFVIGVIGCMAVLFIPARLNQWFELAGRLIGRRVRSPLDPLAQTLLALRSSPSALVLAFGAAVVVQGAFIGVYIAVARALAVPIAPWDLAIIVPLAGLLQIVPISINGFGVREATFTALFARFGLPGESALLVSLEATALMMGFSVLGAILYAARQVPLKAPEAAEVAVPS